jgi:drug/metabolite transporter (DMT)-like permease
MGYAQELSRSMSKFSNFAISFSIICILSGGINSFAQAISSVGGAGAGIGWIVFSDPIRPSTLLGGAIIVASIAGLARYERLRPARPAA